ncbi:hypothetical protein BDF14DRAFT_1733848, partial [Spinellus fusiger]
LKWKPKELEQGKSKVPLVVFGLGMLDRYLVKFKGNKRVVTGIFWRALKIGETKGDMTTVAIEYKTSKICN